MTLPKLPLYRPRVPRDQTPQPARPHPSPPRTSAARRWTRAAALALPLVAWLIATLAFLGDVPRWNDDYFFCQRDFATGERIGWVLTTREPYLPPTGTVQAWRPLHHVWLPAMVTALWDTPRLITLTGALIHLLATTLLYRMLRALGRSRHASAAAAIWYLIWPLGFEPVLWAAAFSTSLACAAAFTSVILAVRIGQDRVARWPSLALQMLALAALIAITVTLNEQPASIAGVVPLAILAIGIAREADLSREGALHRAIRTRLPRDIIAGIVGASVVAAYVVNVRVNGQRGLGNDPDSYVPLTHLPARIIEIIDGLVGWITLQPLAVGAWRLAWREAVQHPLPAAAWTIAFLLAAIASYRVWTKNTIQGETPRINEEPDPARNPAAASPAPAWTTILIGLAMLILGSIPIAAIVGYQTNSRTATFMFAGVCVLLAGLTDPLGTWMERVPRRGVIYRHATALALTILIALGCFIYVGVQARFRVVDAWNKNQLARLVERVPNPAPDTAFLPIAVRARPLTTGHRAFDRNMMTCWEATWMLPYAVREAYQRPDVYMLYHKPAPNNREHRVIGMITPEWMQFEWSAATKFPFSEDFGAWLDWPRLIPVVVDADGPHPVSRLIVRRKAHPNLIIDIPQTSAMVARGEMQPYEFVYEQE